MANEKISQLPTVPSSSGSDLYPLVQSATTSAITFTNLQSSIASATTPSQLPAITLTGNVTGSASGGTIATTIASGVVINSMLANMVNNTVKGNKSGVTGAPSDLALGNLTEATSSVLNILGGTEAIIGSGLSIQVLQATATESGYLSSADWNTFNAKQPAGNYITGLTGDATASGPGSVVLTLATVNPDSGSFGSSTSIPSFTINGKGLITAASGNAVIAPAGTLSGTTLNSTVVSSSLTSVGTISSGVWNGTSVAVPHGGTGLSSLTAHGILLGEGASNVNVLGPDSTAGVPLLSQGASADPAYGPVSLSGVGVAGILPIVNGGTNENIQLPNGVTYFNGTGITSDGGLTYSGMDGGAPNSLILSGSKIYGTTIYGGGNGIGTIFSVNTDGTQYQCLYSFGDYLVGRVAVGKLVLSGSILYGITTSGGNAGVGSIFQINTNGTGYTQLYYFTSGSDGGSPAGGLILSGGLLYGTNALGGTGGAGVLFSFNPTTYVFTTLYNFVASTGDSPAGQLLLSGSTLYGVTSAGGTAGYGVIYSVSITGTGYTVLHNFLGGTGDGQHPNAGLTLIGSTLYGTTPSGGAHSGGTLFSVSTTGTGYTLLYSFLGSVGGGNPTGSLILSGSTFYGITSQGGALNYGLAYSISTSGTGFTDLFNFASATGIFPTDLILSGSTLYGTTNSSGSLGSGTLYSMTDTGSGNSVLHAFSAANGSLDVNGPLQAYGTAQLNQGLTVLGGSTSLDNGSIYTDGHGDLNPVSIHTLGIGSSFDNYGIFTDGVGDLVVNGSLTVCINGAGSLSVGPSNQVALNPDGSAFFASNALSITNTGALTTSSTLAGSNLTVGGHAILDLLAANNLSDVASATVAATNLGLGTGNSPKFTGLTLSGLTPGSIPYVGTGGLITQDNSHLSYTSGGTLSVGSALVFPKNTANAAITVNGPNTVSSSGVGALTIQTANGGGTSGYTPNGGNLYLYSGLGYTTNSSFTGGTGGAIFVAAGNAGSNTSGTGGSGGGFFLNSGNGGSSGNGAGGIGGIVNITPGEGGNSTGGTGGLLFNGGGGAIQLTAASGGSISGYNNASGNIFCGGGSSVSVYGGTGGGITGSVTASSASLASGGSITINTGSAGSISGTNTISSVNSSGGGSFTVSTGSGSSVGTTGTPGQGGLFSVSLGGSGTTGGSTGAAGSSISLTAGAATSTAGTSATGGNIYLLPGIGGPSGLAGNIYLNFTPGSVKGLTGIGMSSTPLAQLHILNNTSTIVSTIVQGAASQTADLQEWQNNGGTVLANIDKAGNIGAQHLVGKSASPTIAAGTGAGTSPTITVSGTDIAGMITLTTGTLPAASAAIATVTFASAYATSPYCVFSPANINAASLSGTTGIYATTSTANFVLNANTVALTAATQYIWYYNCIQ